MIQEAQQLLSAYNKLEVDNLYELATRLLDLLTDEEYLKICSTHKELLAPISAKGGNEYVRNPIILRKIVDVFTETLEKRNLSGEEFCRMSLEEVLLRIDELVSNVSKKTNKLYDVIRLLEQVQC